MNSSARDYEVRIWYSPEPGDECYIAQVLEMPGIMAHGATREAAAHEIQIALALLEAIRKEQLPFWSIWEELDRGIGAQHRAEIGNINDAHIVEFGPYVDLLNVDKRIADVLRRTAQHNPLLRKVYERVPSERGIKGVLSALKKAQA